MHRMTPHGHQEKWSASWKLAMNSATGFLRDFYSLRPACQERKETVRFPGVDVRSGGLALRFQAGVGASLTVGRDAQIADEARQGTF